MFIMCFSRSTHAKQSQKQQSNRFSHMIGIKMGGERRRITLDKANMAMGVHLQGAICQNTWLWNRRCISTMPLLILLTQSLSIGKIWQNSLQLIQQNLLSGWAKNSLIWVSSVNWRGSSMILLLQMGNETCKNFCDQPEHEIIFPANIRINVMPPDTTRTVFQNTPRQVAKSPKAPEVVAPPVLSQPIEKLVRDYTIQKLLGKSITTQPWGKKDNIYYRAVMPRDDQLGAGIFVVKELESVYVGEFNQQFKCSGQGLLVAGDHSQYKGEFINGMAHGEGTLIQNNITAEGIWQYGVFIKGKIKGQGYEYEGQLKDGKPHGQGHYRKGPCYFYQGDFHEGLYHGVGVESSQQYIYNGEWIKGKKQGQGRIEYDDTSIYNGHWVNDQKDGQGIFVSKTGAKWQGLWSQGEPQKGRWL